MKNVQNIVYLYRAFKLFSLSSGPEAISYCALAHGKFISVFDMIGWNWMNHLEFTDEVLHLFLHTCLGVATDDEEASTEIKPSCILKNGLIYTGFMIEEGLFEGIIEAK